MSIQFFLDYSNIEYIEYYLLDFLDYEDNIENKYQNLKNIFDEIKIHNNQFKIKMLLYMITNISNNHHHESDFFSKIEKVLYFFKNDMKKYFSNNELFHFFKRNKRLLLFLLEEDILIMNEYIAKKVIYYNKYYIARYQYFQPEIQPFINEKWFPKDIGLVEELKKELPDNFYEKRKISENDSEICKLIQKDLIEDFIIYISKNSYPVNSTISPSIYETNHFLLKQVEIALIEYAVFFGSIQIFNYLRLNGAELSPLLWIYAIHSQNPEIINFLEEFRISNEKNGPISFKSKLYSR